MGIQMTGQADFISMYQSGVNIYDMIISMIYMMPHPMVVLSWLIITMVAFYATSFDSIAFIASCYSYHRLEEEVIHLERLSLSGAYFLSFFRLPCFSVKVLWQIFKAYLLSRHFRLELS